jgi:iron(III) transport system permease protein
VRPAFPVSRQPEKRAILIPVFTENSLRIRRFDFKWLIIGGSIVIVAYFALIPLFFLLWQSFFTPRTATKAVQFTFDNYLTVYYSSETARLFWNSLQFAAGTALFSFVIGTLLAWLNERTNTPFKKVFFALSIVPLIVPGILFTVAWILLGSPKIGILNLTLQHILNTNYVFFDVYSMGGMIWVAGLHYSPMAFLLMSAAFRYMDPALEESAMMSGANIFQILYHITVKLTWPAIFATILILFIRAIESFEVPALLGLPVGIRVFTSSIFQAIHRYPSQIGLASAYATTLLLITAGGIYFQSRLSGGGHKYSTMTGKGYRPHPLDLGKWRYLTGTIFTSYLLLIVLLPFLVLLWSSLQKFYRVPSLAALQNLTLDAYRFVWDYPSIATAVRNSFLLSLGSATIVMFLTAVITWVVVKTSIPGRWLLDNLASLPLVFPGLVLGLSIMIFYLHVDIGVYGTLWILLIAYTTRFLPYGIRYNTASMLQIHKELEESAAMSGASWSTTFRKIILPLIKPGFVAGWIYILIVSIRELSSSILLYSAGTEVVSVVIWELWEGGQYVQLSALGVLFISALFFLVVISQMVAGRFGLREA